jgi:chromosomal replication initiator protein
MKYTHKYCKCCKEQRSKYDFNTGLKCKMCIASEYEEKSFKYPIETFSIDKRQEIMVLMRVRNRERRTRQLKENNIQIELITRQVAGYFWIPYSEIIKETRELYNVFPRQVAQYFCKKTGASMLTIARFYGRKNHVSAFNSCKRVENFLTYDKKIRNDISEITKLLANAL